MNLPVTTKQPTEKRKRVDIPPKVALKIYKRWIKRLHSLQPSNYVFHMMELIANDTLKEYGCGHLQMICNHTFYTPGKPMGFQIRDLNTRQKTDYR
jgi:hypothetical protein